MIASLVVSSAITALMPQSLDTIRNFVPPEVRAWQADRTSPFSPAVKAWIELQIKLAPKRGKHNLPADITLYDRNIEAALLSDIRQCREVIEISRKTGVRTDLIPVLEGVIERTEQTLKKVWERHARETERRSDSKPPEPAKK